MRDRHTSTPDLEELTATDTGARHPAGFPARLMWGVALAWSLFQLWIASPLPFMLGFGVFNDTEARSLHLAFALFLAYLAYPAFRRSPREYIPLQDWIFAVVGAFCGAYLYIFQEQIADRVGAPILQDYVAGIIGILLLLEAARRALGPALVVVASTFLIYTYFGPYMPAIIAHKGNSLGEIINHQWITTEGVFGVALGVSASFVFLFVLFGSLLDKAGAGNYFIKVAFALLGHLRGGPAKAAVVSSGMTGLISGSSIANVVTTGTFTIPLMKRVGFSAEKAGAVEVASSVNGQIMPPVMGAAAFLMTEFVGIPYFQVVTHAFVPAVISYIALFYIVHLEAVKLGMEGLPRRTAPRPWLVRLMNFALGVAVLSGLSLAVYYGVGWLRAVFPNASTLWLLAGVGAAYVALVAYSARYPDLELDTGTGRITELPEPGPTIRAGLHYLVPVVVLVWALMVDHLSPGLSAFYGAATLIVLLLTQHPLKLFFRGGGDYGAAFRRGVNELLEGLVAGARNMIGIAVATATAGIIVGAVTQTGVGSMLAEVVEVISGGNMLVILLLTAVLSLILGMGLPTTANYIVVSALLAPVIVQLGQQTGLIVPLIAVHLFVFYFGIMADVTPPVGLAAFAAAAVSGGDPIRTGFVAFFYSLRTALLPFLFIYNTDLLLIDVSWYQGIFIFLVATVAMLLFAAATQGWFLTRCNPVEIVTLLLVAFTLFRPGFWMDLLYPPYRELPPTAIFEAAERVPPGGELRLRVLGTDDVGDPLEFVAVLPLPAGADGRARLEAAGLTLKVEGEQVIVDDAAFGSAAKKAGFEWDQRILLVLEPQPQPSKYWMYVPAFLLLGLVVAWQRRRLGNATPAAAATSGGA